MLGQTVNVESILAKVFSQKYFEKYYFILYFKNTIVKYFILLIFKILFLHYFIFYFENTFDKYFAYHCTFGHFQMVIVVKYITTGSTHELHN